MTPTLPRPFFLILMLVCLAALPAPGAEPDGPAAREVVANAARTEFKAGNYAELEKTAEDLRKTKARFPEGVWKLPSFYDGLSPKVGWGKTPDWKGWFDKLDAWKAAFPDSLTQPVVRSQTLTDYAWDARGSGFGNTVSTEGWKLFAERLAQARGVLEDAAKTPARDPDWYRVMQTVALGENWSHDRYVALFDEAVTAEPTYYHYYFSRVGAELPRWGGQPDAWIDFADEAARKYDPQEGLTMYTRIVWSHIGTVGGGFQNPKVDWKKVRQGFRDIEKSYPDSNWNLNNFCRFACLAGDRATARELFDRLGDGAVSLPTWESRSAFEGWRQWAKTDEAADSLRATLAMPTDERLAINAVAFSPDGTLLLAGYDDGGIRLWDLASKKVVWGANLRNGKAAAVAFSRDGKLFAAGTGDQYNNKTPGSVKIWQTETREPVARVDGRQGNVFALAFTPDGKSLAIAGGSLGDGRNVKPHGELALYDLETKKLNPLPWADGGYVLDGLAISSDGQFLATPKGHSMNCWSLTKQAFVADFHTRSVHEHSVQAVAFLPDGKTFVTGTAPGWDHRGGSGELRRWDTTAEGWPERKDPAWPEVPSGVLALAVSPDGKWLATGGYDGSVQLHEVATGKVAATLTGHHQSIGSLAFAPDGKTLASGAGDGTIKWWNVPAVGLP